MLVKPVDDVRPAQDATAGTGQRWIVLACVWMALLLSTVCRLAWASVALPLGHSLALPIAALGVFVTAFYSGYVLSNVIGGVATDRFGGRIALSVSLVGLAAATICFGYTPSFAAGLILQALMGLTAGADYAAGVKLVSTWFAQRRRGRAIGLLMSASSVAVIVSNALLPYLVQAYGWRAVYRGLGLTVLAFAFVVFCVVRDRGPQASENVPPPARGSAHFKAGLQALSTKNFALLAIAGCGAFWGTLGFAAWAIPLMVKGHGMSATDAGWIVATAGVAGLLSKPSIGWLSDRLGARRKLLTIVSLLFFCVMLLIFGGLSGAATLRIVAPLVGIGAFVYSPLLVTMVAEQAGAQLAGSGAGVANAVWQLGSALAPAAVGMTFQATHSLFAAFATLAAGPLFGGLCMLFVKERRAG
ncbi:MFS transporter [Trinickia mobilis]|uniref:MFS transporter n=1 Tax=Trinickia mobilis TaxID=2816356 RepID=UPI001A8E74B1|nr:MFS transporter [Trinickia mobilis]